MFILRVISILLSLVVVNCADAGRIPHGDSSLVNVVVPLKIGAGGFISGEDIQCDQGVGACAGTGTVTKVIRTDTYGAYVYNSAAANPGNAGGTGVWQQLLNSTAFPVTAGTPYQPANGKAVNAINIAPSNTNHLYIMTNGLVYSSTNKGASWTQTAFTQVTVDAGNQATSSTGPYMAVDPKNENIVVVGAPSSAWYTLNGGTSWTQITGLCTPTTPPSAGNAGGFLVAFDPSSGGTTSTPGVYLSCYGTGLYHSSTGASGSFTSVSGAPTTFSKLYIDSSGVVYVIDNAATFGSGNLKKLASGSWSTITTGLSATQHRALAIDPASTHLLAVDAVGNSSFFNGTSWSASQLPTVAATDIPWLAHSQINNTFAGSDIKFDPSQSNVVFYSNGVGVATGNPSSGAGMAWNSVSSGIEQLVPMWGVSPPGGNPIIAFFDRPVFTITNQSLFPTDYGLTYSPGSSLIEGFSVDYASSSASFIAIAAQSIDDHIDTSGFSSNGGGATGAPSNWTFPFAGYSAITDLIINGGLYHGGNIAVSTPTCVVFTVGNGGIGATRAASGLWQWNGTTWSSPTISGIPTTGNPGWGNSYFLVRNIVVADRVNANTVYAYNTGVSGGATAGLYRTTNCSTWSRVNVTSMPFDGNASAFNSQMRAVPGIAGNLFFTSGWQAPDATTQPFYQSTDGGVNWSAVTSVTDVSSFDFGKVKPGETTPALYLYGRVGGVLGLWRGTNNFSTWTQLAASDGAFPGGSLDTVSVVIGDINTYGLMYICFAGSSCKKIQSN